MSQDTNTPKNRHERRALASLARRKKSLDRESKIRAQSVIDVETRKAALEKKTEAARKRGEARRAFKRKIALEKGVNPRRVVLLGVDKKLGVMSYKIRMS